MWVIRLITAAFLLNVSSVQASSIDQQRAWFQQAHKALTANKTKKFQDLKAKLVDYPLTPYLYIWQARKGLKRGEDSSVNKVLKQYANIPEASSLHLAWIKMLARQGKWSELNNHLEDFPKTRTRLSDIAMVAKWRLGGEKEKKDALQEFSEHWRKGGTVSEQLLPLYSGWKKQQHPTIAELWSRIGTFARKRHWRKVKILAKSLSKRDRNLINRWKSIQKEPSRVFERWEKAFPPKLAYMILADSFNRLPREDVEQIWQRLLEFKAVSRLRIDDNDYVELKRRLALRAAKQHVPAAADWLAGLPDAFQNEETRAWQVRVYLLANSWKKVRLTIEQMPLTERQQSRWTYWRARSLEMAGNTREASMLFTELAAGRGYYSFLSAERIRRPYRFLSEEMDVSLSAAKQLAQKPAIRRAYEWIQLGKLSKANSEWFAALAGAKPGMWKAAADLALKWGWYNRMIHAAYKAGEMNAMQHRFPMGFELAVKRAARETGLPEAQIWSVIRQESAFNYKAVSRAGARGLMQLMPKTAKQVARQNKMKHSNSRLFSPNHNVRLGSLYLAAMKKRFKGNMALATAAYNAGPHRVKRWLKRTPLEWEDTWIEAIPFNETRRYVQQIKAFVIVYDWREKNQSTRLAASQSAASGVDHLIMTDAL